MTGIEISICVNSRNKCCSELKRSLHLLTAFVLSKNLIAAGLFPTLAGYSHEKCLQIPFYLSDVMIPGSLDVSVMAPGWML